MPAILEKCVMQVQGKGHTEQEAWAICKSAMDMCAGDEAKVIPTAEKMCAKIAAKEMSLDYKAINEFALPETKDIRNVEIFAAGTWNGDTYTTKDIDQMVATFNSTKKNLPPYLKLGHDNGQALAQKDGFPSLGWIENLRRVGKKLVADFTNIPSKIYDLISSGAYRKVSAEIFPSIDVEGKVYKNMLKAVALLGADTPAVKTLDDIISLYASHGGVKVYEDSEIESKSYSFEISEKENKDMDKIAELETKLADSQKELTEAKAKITELEPFKAQAEEFKLKSETLEKEIGEVKTALDNSTKELKKYSDAQNAAKVETDVNKLITDKKILPAQKEQAVSMLTLALNSQDEKKFSVDGKEVSQYDYLLAFMQKGSVDVKTSEESLAGARQNADDLDSKAKTYIADQKKAGKEVSYKEALIAISPAEGIPALPLEKPE